MPLSRLFPRLLLTAALLAPVAAPAQAPPGTPPQLTSFRALRGADFMDAERYAEAPDRVIGRVTDIRGGEIDGRPGQEIALVGLDGIAFFPVTGGEPRNIQLFSTQGQPNTFMTAVDINADGVLEFLEAGGDPNAPAFVPRAYNISGQPIWTKANALNPRKAALFLADRLEAPQFLVAEEGGLTLETINGERLRRFPVVGNLTYMELVDVDRDGKRDVVVLTDGRAITVMDQLGATITSGSLPVPTKMVTVTGFPNQRDHAYMVLCGEGEIGLFNFDGTLAVRLEAPFCSNALAALVVAHPVRLVAGESDFLAVLVQYPEWDRSIVYLYSPTGQLVYMRCVPGYVTSMNTLVLDDSGAEQLFTGGNGNIYINPVIGALPRG